MLDIVEPVALFPYQRPSTHEVALMAPQLLPIENNQKTLSPESKTIGINLITKGQNFEW